MPSSSSNTNEPIASTSRNPDDRPRGPEPKYLRMTKPMVFDIAYTDCPDGRVPSHVMMPRHIAFEDEVRRGVDDEVVVAPKSDEPHRRYWKLVIGTYMMHYGKLHHNLDPHSLYRLRKFPAGYELYARPRLSGSSRNPDQYLIGFDRLGERKILFDSPYAFVLHAIALTFGSTRNCPCKVCDNDMKQKDIRKVLRDAAPYVKIPSVTQWKKRLRTESRTNSEPPNNNASRDVTSPVSPNQTEIEVKTEMRVKAEPMDEDLVKIEASPL